jgi:hypothetical protein
MGFRDCSKSFTEGLEIPSPAARQGTAGADCRLGLQESQEYQESVGDRGGFVFCDLDRERHGIESRPFERAGSALLFAEMAG